MNNKIKTVKSKIQIIESVFGEGIFSKNGKNISVLCPSCKKSSKTSNKKKLSICLETGRYHCWVCEKTKGKNVCFLVKKNTKDSNIIEQIFNLFEVENTNLQLSEKEELSLPNDFKLLSLCKTKSCAYAKNYLYKRNVSDENILRYKIGVSQESKFVNRVIFPSFDSDLNLNYYLTRTYDKNNKIKYRNCDANKKDIIFNENMIDWRKPLVLVEGVFDALKINTNVACMLGSWIDESHLLFQKIVKNKTDIILALDADAVSKSLSIAKNLSKAKPFDNTNRMRYLISEVKSGSIF
jgi:hypothetical protein